MERFLLSSFLPFLASISGQVWTSWTARTQVSLKEISSSSNLTMNTMNTIKADQFHKTYLNLGLKLLLVKSQAGMLMRYLRWGHVNLAWNNTDCEAPNTYLQPSLSKNSSCTLEWSWSHIKSEIKCFVSYPDRLCALKYGYTDIYGAQRSFGRRIEERSWSIIWDLFSQLGSSILKSRILSVELEGQLESSERDHL